MAWTVSTEFSTAWLNFALRSSLKQEKTYLRTQSTNLLQTLHISSTSRLVVGNMYCTSLKYGWTISVQLFCRSGQDTASSARLESVDQKEQKGKWWAKVYHDRHIRERGLTENRTIEFSEKHFTKVSRQTQSFERLRSHEDEEGLDDNSHQNNNRRSKGG
jgi:hypothetical protein